MGFGSPSPRRAWIEIQRRAADECHRAVALPTEGVDRNPVLVAAFAAKDVALPTEGVDRNLMPPGRREMADVALPTEGVDRNAFAVINDTSDMSRPPHGGRG